MRTSRRYAAAVLVLAAVALAIRCYRLGAQSFWIDEISVTSFVRSGHLLSALRDQGGPFEPPVAYLLVWGALRLPLAFETAARVPSAVFGAVEVVALVLLAREATGRRSVALVAGALLALAPFSVRYAQEARYYTAFSALALLSWWLLLRALRSPSWGRWLLWGSVVAAMELTHPFTPLVVVLQLLLVAGTGLWRRRQEGPAVPVRQALGGLAFGVVLTLPWYAYGASRWIPDALDGKEYSLNDPGTFDVRLSFDLLRRLGEWLLGNATHLTVLVALLGTLVALAPFVARGAGRRVALVVLALVALVVVVLVPLAHVMGTYFAMRRVEFLTPPLLLVAAIAVVAIGERALSAGFGQGFATANVAVLALALVAVSAVSTARYFRSEKTDYRAFADVVAKAPRDTTVVVGPVPERWEEIIPQYLRWRGVRRPVHFLRTQADARALARAVPAGTGPVLWITGSSPAPAGLDGRPLGRLDRLQVIGGDESWGNVTLPWFVARTPALAAAALRTQRAAVAVLPPFVVHP